MRDNHSDAALKDILRDTKVIAAVGVSTNPIRPSNYVARYLSRRDYRVIPVNPAQAGQALFGETVLESLADIPRDAGVDMLDIFRRSEFVPDLVDEALAALPDLRTVWMQIGVRHGETAAMLREKGIAVVEDRCPKMEHQRLFMELRKAGIATGIISSRLDR